MQLQPIIDDSRLNPILEKVQRGERLSFEDGVTMYRSGDIQTFVSRVAG